MDLNCRQPSFTRAASCTRPHSTIQPDSVLTFLLVILAITTSQKVEFPNPTSVQDGRYRELRKEEIDCDLVTVDIASTRQRVNKTFLPILKSFPGNLQAIRFIKPGSLPGEYHITLPSR